MSPTVPLPAQQPGAPAGRVTPPAPTAGLGRKSGAVVLLALLSLLALAGCSAGAITQTSGQASAVNGATGQAGNVAVRDATIEFTGNLAGDIYRQGRAAPLSMTLVNTGAVADRLVSVSSPVAGSAQVVGDAVLPGGSAVTVGNNSGVASSALARRTVAIRLAGLNQPIRAGLTYPVTLRFERAGELTLLVPVGYPTGELAERK